MNPPIPIQNLAAENLAGVRLTHPEKIFYPAQRITKRDLAEYFEQMAPRLLPYVTRRPLSLVRCPQGHLRGCFFQRHPSAGMPRSFHAVRIPGTRHEPYIYVNSAGGLIAAAQLGALELHLWGSRIDDIEHPDRLIFDIDPDPDVAFSEVKRAARLLRDILMSASLKSFVMLTGGKGLHVVVPLKGSNDWPEVKAFSQGIASALAKSHPERYLAKANKQQRKGRIFIDWMRNMRSSTAIAPWSTRAREGCPIAVPVDWAELARIKRADQYQLRNIGQRLKTLKHDPWAGYFQLRQQIPRTTLTL
ncbi:MAG: non-homologous end-joining DNA ligase, partial [Chromatiales bacterium]|nr:non-homologous end-joining DNA ligase [Chromatiales bacterium]